MRNKGRLFILFLVSLLWLPACVNVPKFVPGELDADIDADLGAAGGPVDQGVEMGLDSARDVMDQSVQDAFTDTDVATISDEGVPSPLIQITASRDSGVAPLLVHFSVEAVGDAISQRDLYNAEYQWTLGDGALQETSYEPMAVQIYDFEAAGDAGENVITVEVSVTVTLPNDGGTLSASTTVSVEDPDEHFSGEKTVCYARAINGADADYEGCPDGASRPDLNGHPFSQVLNELDRLAGRRILFRRGQTFQWGDQTVVLTADGDDKPTLIGAFGTDGARPILEYSGTEDMLALANAHDVRIQDVVLRNVRGVEPPQENTTVAIDVQSEASGVLMDRVEFIDFASAISEDGGAPEFSQSAITRSVIGGRHNTRREKGEVTLSVSAFAFVDNEIRGRGESQNSNANHITLKVLGRTLIRNNHWSAQEGEVSDSLLNLQLNLINDCPPPIVIAGNHFTGGGFNQIVDLVSEDRYEDNPCAGYVRFERNQLTWRDGLAFDRSGSERRAMVVLQTKGAVLRNNIFDLGPVAPDQNYLHYGIYNEQVVGIGGLNHILHNTFTVGACTNQSREVNNRRVYAVGRDDPRQNAVLVHNLLLAPDAGGPDTIDFSNIALDEASMRVNYRYTESWPFGVSSLSSEPETEADYRLRPGVADARAVPVLNEVPVDFGGQSRGAMTLPGAWADPSTEPSDGGCTPRPSD
ncbi:MAG: PKD domain-containing protein [Bradymonadia bacterium]